MMMNMALEPTGWSRNWVEEFESDDEDQEPPTLPSFTFKSEGAAAAEADHFVVAVGVAAAAVADACTTDKRELYGTIVEEDKESRFPVYVFGGSTIVACVDKDISVESCYNLTKALFSSVATKRTTVLSTINQATLPAGQRVDPAGYVRTLRTTTATATATDYVPLEAPALVDGLTAAILAHCEARGQVAEAFLCLEERHVLGLATMEMLDGVAVGVAFPTVTRGVQARAKAYRALCQSKGVRSHTALYS